MYFSITSLQQEKLFVRKIKLYYGLETNSKCSLIVFKKNIFVLKCFDLNSSENLTQPLIFLIKKRFYDKCTRTNALAFVLRNESAWLLRVDMWLVLLAPFHADKNTEA